MRSFVVRSVMLVSLLATSCVFVTRHAHRVRRSSNLALMRLNSKSLRNQKVLKSTM